NLAAAPTLDNKIAHGTSGLDLTNGDFFGRSVALSDSGSLLAVGALGDDTGGSQRGAVYLLTLDPADLAAAPTLNNKITHGTSGLSLANRDFFGGSVALNDSGSLLAVGAVGDNSGGDNRGAVYLFSAGSNPQGNLTDTFATNAADDTFLTPAQITALLNAGNNVTLQFNNDLTVLSDVIASAGGNGGDFTIQTGRSIFINANINTDGGSLGLFANQPLAAGVVDTQRDPGAAVITMAMGTTIDTGTGNFLAQIGSGAGLTNNTSGDLTITTVNSGGSVLIENLGPSIGDINVAANTITITGPLGTTLRSLGNINVNGSVQNTAGTMAGEGGVVNLIAGWDGVTGLATPFDITPIFANTGSFGNNNGSVVIGDGMQATGIAVGSRFGPTNVAADDLTIQGVQIAATNGFAQLGFRADTSQNDFNIDGPITVVLSDGSGNPGDLTATGGSAENAYAQLGHGGNEGDGNFSGAIMISANDLNFTGGSANDTYAHLGHGGDNADGDHSGVITVAATGNLLFMGGTGNDAYAQLGHGGNELDGDATGNIFVTGNNFTFTGGTDNDTYAQLGHGGDNADGDHSGVITVSATGNLTFTGGSDRDAYAQLGHGGVDADDSQTGNINIIQANNITFMGGSDDTTYAQLGHGGPFSSADQNGDITINQANNLTFIGGSDFGAYAQLGHGGVFVNGDQGLQSGDITINQANDFTFTAGTEFVAYAQLGHGGAVLFGDQNGDITIAHANNFVLTGGDDFATYAQLGHGGIGIDGDQNGNISILQANDVSVSGGIGENAYAQLGHGGSAVEIETEDQPFGGGLTQSNQTGNIFVRLVGSDLFLTGGTGPNAYSQLGHGAAVGGNSSQIIGDINVIIDGSAFLVGNSATSPALLGHATTNTAAITGNLVLAIDQINPIADNGGRLFMNQFSAIDMGGVPNQVRIFGTRRLGNVLADGAVINGIIVDSSLPPGTLVGNRWNPNTEFVNWNHEQWGSAFDEYTLAKPGPFTAPFTFFFLGEDTITPQVFPLPYDRFVRYSDYANSIFHLLFPNGPFKMFYGEWPARPLEDEETGATSADIYDP
ncbi:MAG: hypothetical protein HOK71_06420, partial [Planctomycetaceae bacterium]|nr:hypothetical protein [Planctomycetaceae bacterium]